MSKNDLSVAILWHMHQPDYVDSLELSARMPWVRLHSLLSYYDMVRVVGEVPGARANFNVAPVLLRQLEQLVAGGVEDDFLGIARRAPADLADFERRLLVQRFFAFNHSRRFAELPRLAELWAKRETLPRQLREADVTVFSDAELRDLQVGFHLAWSGRTLREHSLLKALFSKGMDFSEAEKIELLALQQEFVGKVLPAYRRAAREGSIEISCTPYYHPILPLLCDTDSAAEARPDLQLPARRFRWPGDAWFQVRTALTETERILGVRPVGMWPAEGALSEAAVRVFATEKVRWLGCDQDVLAAAWPGPLPEGGHYQPFRRGEKEAPAIFFRDKELSNRIGFVYSAWSPRAAADDMVAQLRRIRDELPSGRFLVPIMLDGENPWEAYSDGGMPFLRRLYEGVQAQDGLRWTTLGQYLMEDPAPAVVPLDRLPAGSWIRRDLTTWIGHPEKNAGWDRLHRVRDWLEERLSAAGALRPVRLAGSTEDILAPDPDRVGPKCDSQLARAWRALSAAEGSDWFWWYGDDHPTAFAVEFDELFRSHLAAAYRHLDQQPDSILQLSLLRQADKPSARPPRFPLQVTLDGKVTSYYEWLDAGSYEPHGGGSMHRTEAPIVTLFFGASPQQLYLRLDPEPAVGLQALAGLELSVQRVDQAAGPVRLRFPEQITAGGRLEPEGLPDALGEATPAGVFDEVVEVGLPWQALQLTAGQVCEFFVTLSRQGRTELVMPAGGSLKLRVPVGPADADDWLV